MESYKSFSLGVDLSENMRFQWTGHHCPNCGDDDTTRSRPKRFDVFLKLLLPFYPRRCLTCYARFWVWQSVYRLFPNIVLWALLIAAALTIIPDGNSSKGMFASAYNSDGAEYSSGSTASMKASVANEADGFSDMPDDSGHSIVDIISEEQESQKQEVASTQRYLLEQKAQREALVLGFLEYWFEQWQQQDLSAYFASYSKQFTPDNGMTLEQWRSVRSERISTPQWITVNALNPIVVLSDDLLEARVEFEQRYVASNYQENSRKVVWLNFDQGEQWKIVAEQVLE